MNITLGQYIEGNSFLHKIDPRIKFVLIIILIISLFLFDIYIAFIGYSVLIIILIYISKIHFYDIMKSLKPLYWILCLTLISNLFFYDGIVIYSNSVFSITKEGIVMGITMSYRLCLLVILSSLLTISTKTTAIADAIEDLLKPLKFIKINSHNIAMIISLGLRFLPTTMREFNQITKAQKSRRVDFESGNLLKHIKNIISIIFLLIIFAFKRADELSNAMEARCYDENKSRTSRKNFSVTINDYKAIFVVFIFILILVTLQNVIL